MDDAALWDDDEFNDDDAAAAEALQLRHDFNGQFI